VPLTSSRSSTRSGNNFPGRLSNTRLQAGVLLCSLLIAGCATPPQTRALPDTWPAELPNTSEIEQAPFFPQSRFQCGPAALATVLVTHGIDVTPEALINHVYIPGLQGSLPEEIPAAARRYGMLSYPLAPRLADLLIEVAHDHPVLVFQNLGLRWLPKWHFAVVVGFDLSANELILRSGTRKRWRTSLATFERTWARGKYWAQVILPPGEIPHTAEPVRYLQAVYDLEKSGRQAAALRAYLAGTGHWPDDAHTWLALGNSHYATGDTASAVAAFHTATRIDPTDPAGWNNLAYALLKAHCPQQALHAASCARQAAPADPGILETSADIKNHANGRDAKDCPAVSCNRR
jgi:hypothetical protein